MMTKLMSDFLLRHTFRIICFSIFLVGIAIFTSVSLKSKNLQDDKPEPARAFTLTEHESSVDKEGNKTLNAVTTQDVDDKGNSVFTKKYKGKDKWEKYETNEKGISGTDSTGNTSSRELPPASETAKVKDRMRTKSFYVNNPNFAGTEMLFGLTVYKLSYAYESGKKVEAYHSLQTGRFPLKYIATRSDGYQTIIETVKLEFK